MISISRRREKGKREIMQQEKEWYTSKEAADYLGIPMHRLARLRREGRIKGIEGGGKNTRYAMYNIEDLKKVDIRDMRTVKNS